MSLTLHEELLTATMQKLTPSQQSSVVKFAKRLAKQNTSKPPSTVKNSVTLAKTTTPQRAKNQNKKTQYQKVVKALDGRTALATQLAHEPPAPVKWVPAHRLSQKEMLSSNNRYFDDGTGVRVFQGGLCNRK
jgi:hypothetical protein